MKKTLLLIALTISLLSCKQNENKIVSKEITSLDKDTISFTKPSNIDFLESLSDICVEDDGVFKNCDELFSKDGSYLFFLIVPKTGALNWYNKESKNLNGEAFEIDNALIKRVKQIKKTDLSKDFDVWVFYTDKKYTTYVGMDAPYNLKTPRIVDLYHLESGKNNWIKIESLEVKNEKEEEKENKWRRDFISKTILKSNEKSIINNNITNTNIPKVSSKWMGKYSAYFSYGKIGGENAGWTLEIEIKEDVIKAIGDGYQISFIDLLTAIENDKNLILSNLKNMSGYKLGEKMNPEFILIEDNGKFYVNSKWIDDDIITKPNKLGYEIDKE